MRDADHMRQIALNAARRQGCDCDPEIVAVHCVDCGDVEKVQISHQPTCSYGTRQTRASMARWN